MSKDTSRRGKFYGAWAEYFSALLSERKLNEYDFARLTGISQPGCWQYLNGGIKPPLDKLELFAQRLHLDPSEKAKFFRLAQLAHSHPNIEREWLLMKRERDDALAEIAALRQMLADGGVDLPRVKRN